MFAFNVWLNGKMIDTVFYSLNKSETIAESVENVRRSLINRDGYSSDIRVTWPKGQRVTETCYELRGQYGHGWETLCSESTMKEARQRRREYAENEGGHYRIVRKLERK